MESVTDSRFFDADLDTMVERCRSLDSRSLWPGVSVDAAVPDKLYYTVSIRLQAASLTDMHVEETVLPVERDGDAVVLRSRHRCTWPDLVVNAASEYRFRPGSPSELTFTYSYDNPGAKIVKSKNLPAFHAGLRKVIGAYLDRLTKFAAAA